MYRLIDHETGEQRDERADLSAAAKRAVRLMLETGHDIRVEGEGIEPRLYSRRWAPAPVGRPSWREQCKLCGEWGRYPGGATCNACRLKRLPEILAKGKKDA